MRKTIPITGLWTGVFAVIKNTDIHTPGRIQTHDLVAKAASLILYRLFPPRLLYICRSNENCGSTRVACELRAGTDSRGSIAADRLQSTSAPVHRILNYEWKKLPRECFLMGEVSEHPVWWFHPCYT
jgi:hypothetical protein